MSDSPFAPPAVKWDVPVMPYVDMTADRSGYTLSRYSRDTGIKGFALAFVGVKEGHTNFTWAGFDSYPAPDWSADEINKFRNDCGGIPVISFGGAEKILPEHSIADPKVLLEGYKKVIDGYKVRHINFDIEATVSGHTVRERNVPLVRDLLKGYPDLRISYSLEINARDEVGIKTFGRYLLRDLQKEGIVPALVNLLIEYLPDSPWDSARKTMEAAHHQMRDVFKLSDEEAWLRIGACPMYGNDGGNKWTLDDHKELRQFADRNKIGCISGWRTNTDATRYAYAYEKIQQGYHPNTPKS
ncbi:hypothetical protein GCM10010211_28820 [Streptomyces albospinus]|uniref:GH18 domain-containing protein n=1 Tax=Streptomyces albospinus TaxID=285515 RepID=A0ABQ2V3U7_9ACTN|nr:hypothetical protein [Streptomyces albospinus]GGU62029.1 hypothetical protein GCM10010211_28820 [Streptomyces albospinus]